MRRFCLLMLVCVGLVSCGVGLEKRGVVYTPEDWPESVKGTVFRERDVVGKRPGVLLIHGGIKLGADGRWLMNRTARELARKGYYVLNITYRSLDRNAYPAQLEDVRAALRWMKQNAEAEGIDVDRLAVFGYSAGGYLGALAAMDERKERSGVKVVVAGGAPTDLTVYRRGDLMKRYVGAGETPEMEKMIEASSLLYVSRMSPPFFMYHGTKDELVRPDHAMKMADSLRYYGVPYQIEWMEGRGHVESFFASGESVSKAIEFMDRYLK